MEWTPHATSAILVADTPGMFANSSALVNRLYGLCLDENNSYIYIVDQKRTIEFNDIISEHS